MSEESLTSHRLRVVVTGMGAISALGHGIGDIWSAMLAGETGIDTIRSFDPTGLSTTFAAEIGDLPVDELLGRKQARRMDRFTQLAVIAARQAVSQSGLDIAREPERTGVIIGSALSGFKTFVTATETMLTAGPRRVSPFAVPMTIPNMAPGTVAIDVGAKGPAFAHASAFASGAHAIGEGVRMIQDGRADAILAGGAEAPVMPLAVAAFAAMGSLSQGNATPTHAVRPFDLHRDGCALGEGAGVLMLEARDHAIARGAEILAEIVGYCPTADAFHEVRLAPEGDGIARAMAGAIADAGMPPSAIGYLNAHGTATVMNDAYETAAIKSAFGDAAAGLSISSTKAMSGHLLGAAGGLEAIISIKALRTGVLPPTINLETPDPACNLDYIPAVPRHRQIDAAMSNSMGFGGHNVSLIFAAHH